MQPEVEELVRSGYAAFNGDDLDGLVAKLHPEIEWVEPREVEGVRTYLGRERIRRFLPSFRQTWAEFQVEPEEIMDAGPERVLVLARLNARGKGSGVPVTARVAHLWTIRDGLAVRVEVFVDRIDALKAAGVD